MTSKHFNGHHLKILVSTTDGFIQIDPINEVLFFDHIDASHYQDIPGLENALPLEFDSPDGRNTMPFMSEYYQPTELITNIIDDIRSNTDYVIPNSKLALLAIIHELGFDRSEISIDHIENHFAGIITQTFYQAGGTVLIDWGIDFGVQTQVKLYGIDKPSIDFVFYSNKKKIHHLEILPGGGPTNPQVLNKGTYRRKMTDQNASEVLSDILSTAPDEKYTKTLSDDFLKNVWITNSYDTTIHLIDFLKEVIPIVQHTPTPNGYRPVVVAEVRKESNFGYHDWYPFRRSSSIKSTFEKAIDKLGIGYYYETSPMLYFVHELGE